MPVVVDVCQSYRFTVPRIISTKARSGVMRWSYCRQAMWFYVSVPCKFLVCSFICCLFATRVQAQEVEQDHAIFCNTQAQIEQFAAYHEVHSISESLEQVNRATPHACAHLLAEFVRGEQIKAVRINWGTVHLYEVLVIGVWRGQWGKVDP